MTHPHPAAAADPTEDTPDHAACTHHGELIDILNATIAGLSHVQLRAELARYDMDPDYRAAPPQDIHTALLRSRPDLARAHRDRVLGPLLAIGDKEYRELLLDTLGLWLDSGSDRIAAAALYCHRNTVQNRLRAIERITGRDRRNPPDLVDLTLALEAYRLLRGAPTLSPERRTAS